MTDTPVTSETKKALPAYLNVTKLQKLIEILSTTRVSVITTDSLKGEFGATDASVAMGTLRFLDLIDETGKAKDVVRGFHLSGEERTQAIAKIVEGAYSQLFEFVVGDKPQNLPQEKLTNHFVKVYSVVPRIATPAVRAFLFLCEEAGMKERSSTPRIQVQRVKKPNAVHAKPATNALTGKSNPSLTVHNADVTTIPFAEGQISFVLPTKVLSNFELIDDYKNVLTAINTFVSKCEPFLKATPNPDDSK